MLLRFGARAIVPIWIADAIGNYLWIGLPPIAALTMPALSILEPVIGVLLLRLVGFDSELNRLRDIAALVLIGAPISTFLNALAGVYMLGAFGLAQWPEYWEQRFLLLGRQCRRRAHGRARPPDPHRQERAARHPARLDRSQPADAVGLRHPAIVRDVAQRQSRRCRGLSGVPDHGVGRAAHAAAGGRVRRPRHLGRRAVDCQTRRRAVPGCRPSDLRAHQPAQLHRRG